MKHYESAFLGLILAGVLTMIAGLGLMMSPAGSPDSARVTYAERRAIAQAPVTADRLSNDKGPATPSNR
jgi:hypothetical protein